MYLCKAGIGSNTNFILLSPWESPRPKLRLRLGGNFQVQSVEDANDVSKAEISKFITALKYKAKNPKDPQAQGAQMVLEDRGLDQHEPIYKDIYIFIKFVIN